MRRWLRILFTLPLTAFAVLLGLAVCVSMPFWAYRRRRRPDEPLGDPRCERWAPPRSG